MSANHPAVQRASGDVTGDILSAVRSIWTDKWIHRTAVSMRKPEYLKVSFPIDLKEITNIPEAIASPIF